MTPGSSVGGFAPPAFAWKQAQIKMDRFIVRINDADLNWGWIVTQRCLAAYATCAVDPAWTLDEARNWIWEQYTGAYFGGDAYPGVDGLTGEVWTRIPDSFLPEFLPVVAAARAAAGRADVTPPTPRRARPTLTLVVNNKGG